MYVDKVIIDSQDNTVLEFIAAVEGAEIILDEEAITAMKDSRSFLEASIVEGKRLYGINTGFGKLADTIISGDKLDTLQVNLLRSHAVGTGKAVPVEVVRGAMFVLASSLARGHSGVRPIVCEYLIKLLNEGVVPFVPSVGSLGASGDLAPLAHLGVFLLGESRGKYRGKIRAASEILEEIGLEPLVLQAKEGLALINGTHFVTSYGVLAWWHAFHVFRTYLVTTALTTDALRGSITPYSPLLSMARPHSGQRLVAETITGLLENSPVTHSHPGHHKIQDAYSLRCSPQILGAVWDAIEFVHQILEVELDSVTDNPLMFASQNGVISGGNFHAEPLALPLSYFNTAIAELAGLSERRIEQLLNPSLSDLPAFLIEDAGTNSGLMIAHYAAAAATTSIRHLANPTVTQNISTSAGQEDFVSMGFYEALNAYRICDLASVVVATELIAACQGLELGRDLNTSKPLQKAFHRVREVFPFLSEDRVMHDEINGLAQVVLSGELADLAGVNIDILEMPRRSE